MPYLGKQAEEGGALIRTHEFLQGTDTASSTSAFSVASSGGDYVRVFLNGVLLQEGASNDYTKTTSAVTIVGTAPADGDILKIDVYESITIWDTVSASTGGTFNNPVTFTGIDQSSTTQNLSGTYSTERMYLNDSYTLTGDVTITGHLALGTIADSDVVITQDSTQRTITGSGTLDGGKVIKDTNPNLTGMVAPFAMAGAPTGWLVCDGTAVSRTTYADLFSAIGTIWGAGNGSSTFNVPDLRGAFLRGTGAHGSSNMADGDDFAGPSVGSYANDQFQDHWFGDNTAKNPGGGTYTGGSGGNAVLRLKDGGKRNYATSHNADNNHGAVDMQYEVDGAGALDPLIPISNKTHGTPRVGSENRPFNAGIQYCIKY